MSAITLAVCIAYALLIAFTLFLDPKGKKFYPRNKYSIFDLLLISSLKMFLVIGIVIAVAAISGNSVVEVVGLSGLSISLHDIAFGLIAALGFLAIYLIWQLITSLISQKTEFDDNPSAVIDLLPKNWLPLIAVFTIISLEAGLLEEIFFRGIIQSHINILSITSCAAVLAGILFGIAHFYQGVSGILGTSVLGIWLGMTYAVTGNLLVPVIGHFLGDFSCMMLGARKVMQYKKNSRNSI